MRVLSLSMIASSSRTQPFRSTALGSPARALEVASSPTRRQRRTIGKRERIAAMEVLCTNGVKSVMLDLIPAFERTSGTKIVITWGSTNGLLKDLEGGARGDLAILTAQAIAHLTGHGH